MRVDDSWLMSTPRSSFLSCNVVISGIYLRVCAYLDDSEPAYDACTLQPASCGVHDCYSLTHSYTARHRRSYSVVLCGLVSVCVCVTWRL